MGRRPRAHADNARATHLIVADISAWVEFLRGTKHEVAVPLRRLLERDEDVTITEIIIAELLSGLAHT